MGVGQSVGSRFVLGELIGRGAMGRVHRATAREDGHEVAVKLLRDDLADQPDVVTRFVQERRLLRAVSHENVVRVHDLIVDGDVLAIVMDLVSDGDLTRLGPTPVEPRRAAEVLAEVADGLAAVHAAGVVHCDLKPANVLVHLRPDGTPQPKLTDFGVSRLLNPTITATQTVFGSPGYLAPEVAGGLRPTPAADVYALGVMLYDFLTGRQPFLAEHPIALLRAHAMDPVPAPTGMPFRLLDLLLGMLEKDPAARPTAAQVARHLHDLAPDLAGTGPFEVPPQAADQPMVGAPPVNPISPVNGMAANSWPAYSPTQSPGRSHQTGWSPSQSPSQSPSHSRQPAWLPSPAERSPERPGTRPGPAFEPVGHLDTGEQRPLGNGNNNNNNGNNGNGNDGDGPSTGSVELPPREEPPEPPGRFRQHYLVAAATIGVLLLIGLVIAFYPRSPEAKALVKPDGDITVTDPTPTVGSAATPIVLATVTATATPRPSHTARAVEVRGTPVATVPVRSTPHPTATTVLPGRPPKVSDQSLPDGLVGVAYSGSLNAKGNGTLTWAVGGGSPPAGLSLSGGGVLSGTPTSSGSSTFTARVTDAAGLSDTATVSVSISAPVVLRPGDINGDGAVDCTDYALLQADLGTSASRSDLNGDGTVDDQDAAILTANLDPGTDCSG